MCRVYFHQDTVGKSNKKLEKHTLILVLKNVTQPVARALVAIRKKKKLVKVKPQHWHILII